MKLNKVISFIVVLSSSFLQPSIAQETKRISPLAMTSVKYKDTYVKVTYSQPAKNKREIFGNLVPYGQVWRAGANEASEITLTRDVVIQNKSITAGTYSLFVIPNPKQWIIILNKDVGLWGAYNYNPKSDLDRWILPIQKLEDKSIEQFTISLEPKNNMANLLFSWDDICVTLPIQFNEPKQ